MIETEMQKVKHRCQDVHKNQVKIRGKVPVDIENENNKQNMQINITERNDMTPLDWLKKFKLKIGNIRLDKKSQLEKRRIIEKLPDLFKNNHHKKRRNKHTIETVTISGKTKSRPIRLHLQAAVGTKVEKLTESGHLEKVKTC